MKITRQQLRRILREEREKVIAEAFWSKKKITRVEDVETIGDLRKLIASAQGAKKWEQTKGEAGSAVKGAIVDEILGKIPGASAAKSMFDFIKVSYELPDESRTGSALDHLDVDDDIAKIVDDPVENAFLKALAKELEEVDGDTPISDINITDMLGEFLKDKFNKRTITGFREGKRMKITKRQLKRIIREEAKSTKKYDDDSALKGGQSKLPDALQKGIIDKTVEDRDEESEEEKNESLRITRRQLRKIIREALGPMSQYTPRKQRSYHQISPGMKSMANAAKRQFAKDYPEIKVKIDGRQGWIIVNGKKAVNISSASGRPMQIEDMVDQMKQAYLGHPVGE